MREDDDRGAGGAPGDVLFQPFELVVAQGGEARRFEPRLKVEDVDQRDEVDAGHVEAVPALALGVLAEAGEIGLAVVGVGDVVLARYVEHLLCSPP